MKFLSPDSGFMRGLSDAVDAIWINILMLITSIPIITIGAALTAGHDATRRTLSGEGTATRNYFAAFRSNFAKSTGYWLIFGTTGALCVYSWIVLTIRPPPCRTAMFPLPQNRRLSQVSAFVYIS
mgnify:CR=1 FL=1